jgi:hypothetical protein
LEHFLKTEINRYSFVHKTIWLSTYFPFDKGNRNKLKVDLLSFDLILVAEIRKNGELGSLTQSLIDFMEKNDIRFFVSPFDINEEIRNPLSSLNTAFSVDQVNQAIKEYINDIKEYPIFFEPEKMSSLSDKNLVREVLLKLNSNYLPSLGRFFEIPYDRFSTRKIISLEIEDIIIRYIIQSELRKKIKFSEKVNKKTEEDTFIVLIDIENYYESISPEHLIVVMKKITGLNDEDLIIELFKNSLKVTYNKDSVNELSKGLILGSKPDDFFAETFIKYIELVLNDLIPNRVERISDELLIGGNSIRQIRENIQLVRDTLTKFGLKINLSKTKVVKDSLDHLITESYLELIDKVEVYGTRSSPSFVENNYFEIKNNKNEIEEDEVKNGESLNSPVEPEDIDEGYDISVPSFVEESEFKVEPSEILNLTELNNYREAIEFLKALFVNYKNISAYQKKYPKFNRFHNIVASKQTDFYFDFNALRFDILDLEKLRILIDIIYRFPKSESYSAIAVQVLVFTAKGFIYDIGKSRRAKPKHEIFNTIPNIPQTVETTDLTKACEFANLKIIELLRSDDIYEYQKYLILRYLFLDDNAELKIENYQIETISDSDYYGGAYGNYYTINPKLPFYEIIEFEIRRINKETQHFALKIITDFLVSKFR